MDDMLKWLPYYYRKDNLVKDVYSVIQTALDKISSDISAEDLRLFIMTTDSFDLHEKDVGITPHSGTDAEIRRANVIAKLRGSNVLTVDELKRLVAVYEPSGVEVIEDYPNYTVILDFMYRDGQPKNINEILAAIEEVKPAHIRIGTNYVRNPTGGMRMGGLLEKSETIPFITVDVTRLNRLVGREVLGGIIQTNRTVTLIETDVSKRLGVGCSLPTAGVIQTEKTINLEVSNG